MAACFVVAIRVLLYVSVYGLAWGTAHARWARFWDVGGWLHVGGTLALLLVAGAAQTRRAWVVHTIAVVAAAAAIAWSYPVDPPMTFSRQVSRVAVPILPWAVLASAILAGNARLRDGARSRLRAWLGLRG